MSKHINKKRVDIVDIQLIRQLKEIHAEILGNPTHIYNFSTQFLKDVALEKIVVICLNNHNKPLKTMLFTIEDIKYMSSQIIMSVILLNCHKIIITTTHINGDPTPRIFDKEFYKQVKQDCIIFGIRVLDYVIIAKPKYYSFLENKFLFEKIKDE